MPLEQNVHDLVAYPGLPNGASHPDNLAAMGMLHGLQPAPVTGCRVLEIGCNEGNNLIPMAYAIPGGQFVGIDLAGAPVAVGNRQIARLGLSNVRLLQADLLEVDEGLGTFDYVIAHGVYAWVPPFVQEGLMALIKKVLAPEGVAYVSYNALPGGHIRLMVREMLQHHVGSSDDATENVNEAIAYLQFISASMAEKETMRAVIERELKQMVRKGPRVTFHDELTDSYEPVSYTAFAGHAGRLGLEPLCEAEFPAPNDPSYKPEVSGVVNHLSSDPVRREQTLDYIRMRRYRETLLCHARPGVAGGGAQINVAAIERLLLAADIAEVAGGDEFQRRFRTGAGNELGTRDPAAIALLQTLAAAWPQAVAVADVRAMLETKGLSYDAAFLEGLFRLVVSQFVRVRSWQAPTTSQLSARPRASEYCRDCAAQGISAVSLLHMSINISDATLRNLILLLDGTRDEAAVAEALRSLQPEVPGEKLVEGIPASLEALRHGALLLREDF